MTIGAADGAADQRGCGCPAFRAAIVPLVDSLALARSLPSAALAATE